MLPEMIYEVDLTGKILFANAHGIKYFGFSKEEMVNGMNFSEIFPNDYKKMIGKINPYGDGKTSEKVVSILRRQFEC